MSRPSRVSPDRILAAAAIEFAARGFAGARVDRIARRARVNKAMLYYHYRSKQGLYRALLRQTFAAAARRLLPILQGDAPPADQLDQVIAGIAAFIEDHAFFPAIMLREIAEGGVHLDPPTLAALAELPRAVGGVVQRGVARKQFRPVNPIAAYFLIVGPIVVYLAGAPIRRELSSSHLVNMTSLQPDEFIRHLQQSMRLALCARPARTR
jgi:TetR/AcrR family transcriptional regulator